MRTLRALAICTLFAGMWLTLGVAHADDRSADPACDDFAVGQRYERLLDFPSALLAYRASASRVPKGACAEDSLRRIDALLDYAEGNFVPWSTLERARRTPNIESDSAALEALLRASEGFPEGKVRGEAKLLVGLALLHSDPLRAVSVLESVAGDPLANTTTRRQALRSAAMAQPSEGIDLVHRHPELASPDLLASLQRLTRRSWTHRLSWGIVSLFLVACMTGLARGRGRLDSGSLRADLIACVAFGGAVGGIGALLVSLYERGHAMPFVALGGAITLIAFMSRAWRRASASGALYTGVRATLSATCCIATSFLVLEGFNPMYLEAFGC